MLAATIEQRLADVFIYSMRAIEPDCIGLLNLDDAIATQTLHPEQMPRNFGKPALLDR